MGLLSFQSDVDEKISTIIILESIVRGDDHDRSACDHDRSACERDRRCCRSQLRIGAVPFDHRDFIPDVIKDHLIHKHANEEEATTAAFS